MSKNAKADKPIKSTASVRDAASRRQPTPGAPAGGTYSGGAHIIDHDECCGRCGGGGFIEEETDRRGVTCFRRCHRCDGLGKKTVTVI